MHTITTALLLISVLAMSPAAIPAPPATGPAPAGIRTVAVISGTNNRTPLFVADHLAKALAKKTSVSVLTPEQVAQKLPDYPADIRGPFKGRYFNTTMDYDNTDIAAVRRIKDKLGVDYLYVVWLSEASTDSFGVTTLTFLTQLFEGRECRLAVNDRFDSSAWGGINCCLAFTEPSTEHQARNLARSCEHYAHEMAKELDHLERARAR